MSSTPPSGPGPVTSAAATGRGPLLRRSRAGKARAWVKRLLFDAVRRPLMLYARRRPRGRRVDGVPTVYILIASAYGMGGTIRAALNLAGHLAQRHPVEVISVYRYRRRSFFGKFPPGVRVTALDDRRRSVAAHGPAGRLREALRQVRSILVHSHDTRIDEFNLWTDIQLVRKLRGLHGWLITTRPGLNLLAAEIAPPGLVTIGQEQMHLGNHDRVIRRAMARLYPRLDALVALTDGDAGRYRELVGDGLRVVTIPNTVRAMPGPSADLGEKTVLAAGRFAHQKGFDLLLPAWAEVAAAHPDWRLRLCGSGSLKAELEAQIAELGLREAVDLQGPADMAEAMANASIFALSSRFEGFPLILLEAMSKGMAVVSFDCPTGPGEIIDDHRDGILVPPRDIEAFAAGLCELIEDEGLRRRCGAAAVATGRQYTIEAVGAQWDALLEELWRRRGERRAGDANGRPREAAPGPQPPAAPPAAPATPEPLPEPPDGELEVAGR
jgi:glycosyltransferase involved in cell wall biosynthesis